MTAGVATPGGWRRRRVITGGGPRLGRQMGLRVISAGTHEKEPGYFHELKGRILESHALVYVVAGGGVFETAVSGCLPVEAGTLLFLVPGIRHRYGPPGEEPWREYWFIYDGFLADRLVARRQIDPTHPVRRPGVRADWVRRWERAFADWEGGGLVDEAALASDLYAILAQALSGSAPVRDDQRVALVEAMQAYLASRVDEGGVDFAAMAQDFNLSYSYARALFKSHTGMAPNQYLTSLKVQRAKELLLATDQRVRAIAAALGYRDPYYFSRLFKKHEGASPEQFRSTYKAWIDGEQPVGS